MCTNLCSGWRGIRRWIQKRGQTSNAREAERLARMEELNILLDEAKREPLDIDEERSDLAWMVPSEYLADTQEDIQRSQKFVQTLVLTAARVHSPSVRAMIRTYIIAAGTTVDRLRLRKTFEDFDLPAVHSDTTSQIWNKSLREAVSASAPTVPPKRATPSSRAVQDA